MERLMSDVGTLAIIASGTSLFFDGSFGKYILPAPEICKETVCHMSSDRIREDDTCPLVWIKRRGNGRNDDAGIGKQLLQMRVLCQKGSVLPFQSDNPGLKIRQIVLKRCC